MVVEKKKFLGRFFCAINAKDYRYLIGKGLDENVISRIDGFLDGIYHITYSRICDQRAIFFTEREKKILFKFLRRKGYKINEFKDYTFSK